MIKQSSTQTNHYANLTNLRGAIADGVIETLENSLICGFRIGGRNASCFTQDDFDSMAITLRNIFTPLSPEIDISFIQINNENSKLRHYDCKHPIAREVTRSRIDYLNEQGINRTDIYVILEFNLSFSTHGGLMLFQPNIKTLLQAIINFNWEEIQTFFTCFLSEKNTYIRNEEITEKCTREFYENTIALIERFKLIMDVQSLDTQDLYNVASFLVNYQPEDLQRSKGTAPSDNWFNSLHRGDAEPVTQNNSPMLLIRTENDTYVKFGSVKGFDSDTVKAGWFSREKESPFNIQTNSVFVLRFKALNPIQKSLFFAEKKREVKRLNVKLGDLISGKNSEEATPLFISSNVKREEELDNAVNLPERWGRFSCHFALFGDPKSINDNSFNIKSRFEAVGASIVWENATMELCYQNMQLNTPRNSIRDFVWNLQQFSAIIPVYKESSGTLRDNTIDREYVFPFTTPQKRVHLFSLWDNGSGINIGCAPIRRGKSFLKNTIATHFGKYDGLYRAVDIDSGTEPVANLYGKDGSIIDINPMKHGGFNPFAMVNDSTKHIYESRLQQMVEEMVESNTAEELRKITKEEQRNLEQTIKRFLYNSPKEHLNFKYFYSDLEDGLREKLESFFDGVYRSLYTNEKEDVAGALDKMYAVYNLSSIKDNPVLKRLAMSEIFFRVTQNFTMPKYRHLPKYLDFDEAHSFLESEKNVENVIKYCRTSGKEGAGIGLYSQHPNEFGDLRAWDVLRSSASSMIFLNDSSADYELYNKVFKLNRSEIETIKIMQPRKEALIVRRNLGISQVVVLDVDEKQYAMTTSQHIEASMRDELIAKYGFREGINQTMEFIRERNLKNDNDEILDEGFE